MKSLLTNIVKKPGFLEALIWLFALAFFAITKPQPEQHFTLCVPHWLGLENCLGCGIGRSISHFLHGNIVASWQMHFFGIPATFILLYRILTLFFKQLKTHIKNTKYV